MAQVKIVKTSDGHTLASNDGYSGRRRYQEKILGSDRRNQIHPAEVFPIALLRRRFSFRDKTFAVIGGGDTAITEALHLTNFASKIYHCSSP